MKHSIILSFCLLAFNFAQAQECVTQLMDSRSVEIKNEIERELAGADFEGLRSVQCLQTVVHVLWNSTNDNLTDSVVQANIELVNRDLRRQNADANLTPDYFLPVAADTEIELRLAQVDPNGQSTNGITHTYTDSISFYGELDHMKYDSTGGVDAWDTEHYLNIWLVRHVEFNIPGGGVVLGYSTLPGDLPEAEKGIVVMAVQFGSGQGWRTLTHELGHFTCLLHPLADSCYNADLVDDTPIASPTGFAISCSDTLISCGNGPYGDMFMNYMTYNSANCMNIFTQGQKERMLNCIETNLPGLREYYYLGVDDVKTATFDVFPNPTSNLLHFQSSDRGSYFFLDIQGREISSGMAQSGKNSVDVSHLPSGIYLLQLQSDKGISTARFIKN